MQRDSNEFQLESLGNLKKVLELSGSSLEKVVKFNSKSDGAKNSEEYELTRPVFLKDMAEMGSEHLLSILITSANTSYSHERGFCRCKCFGSSNSIVAHRTSSYPRDLNLPELAFRRAFSLVVPMRPSRSNALPSCK